jgi:enoyl-CoA hydratase
VSLTTIRLERVGSVLRVVIDHPTSELNAIDGALHHDLDRVFAELRDEAEARVILLTGRRKAFSAGGDFAWFPELAEPRRREEVRQAGKRLIWNLLDLELPVVAAVNGPAMGLGATIALLCDAVFMAEDAVIGDPHVRVGLVAGDGGTGIWPLLVGPMLAKRYLLTGDRIDATEAHRLGLVSHVVDPDRLDGEAMAFCERLAAGAPLAVRYTKAAVNAWVKQAFATAFDIAIGYETVTMGSVDHAEAVAALREKRPPRFEGR